MPITPGDEDFELVERLYGKLLINALEADQAHRYRLTQSAALLRLSMAGRSPVRAVDDVLRHAIEELLTQATIERRRDES